MKKYTLYTNNFVGSDLETEYRAYLNENELSDTDYTIWDFMNHELATSWSDMESNIKCNPKLKNEKFVIFGTIGTWQGKREIIPVVCDNLMDAIYKATKNGETIIISQVNGHVEVEAHHHDGTNYYTICMLNDRGYNAWGINGNADLTNRTYHKAFTAF